MWGVTVTLFEMHILCVQYVTAALQICCISQESVVHTGSVSVV